jgi:hypothetical protein
MTRKCTNWLETFLQWTLPRVEAPASFCTWTGLYTLAAAVKRHVKISKEWLGGWEVSPHLYVIFVAPPGKARKSTTINFTESLLERVPNLVRCSEIVTQAALLDQIVKAQESAIYATIPEFGEFIMKSGMDMYGFLTNLFDGKKHITATTIIRGHEFAERPCINLLAATTPEWIAGNMPASVIGGGFASRVIFIYEDTVRERRLFRRTLDQVRFKELEEDLAEDLTHIALNLKGDFELSKEAQEFFESWYMLNADKMPAESYKLHGYFERKPAHAMKIAQLYHLAYSDELCLAKKDFEFALKLLETVEVNLPKVFVGVGKNLYTFDTDRILDFITEKGKAQRREVISHFYSSAEPLKIQEILDALIAMHRIEIINNGSEFYYAPAKIKE